MPRGGARVNSGPPPDPHALRRDRKDDRAGWTTLPAEGRTTPTPPWPLGVLVVEPTDDTEELERREETVRDVLERERDVWAELWRLPQAVVWERNGWTHEVAVYTRLLVAGESTANVKQLAEARMWSDRLGLNPAAMLRNRWRISEDELAARRSEASAAPLPAQGRSMRSRLSAVQAGGK